MTGLEPLVLGALGAGAGYAGGLGTIGTGLLGIGGALTGLQLGQSRNMEGIDLARLNAEKEQAKLAASERALSNAQAFRRSLSSQMALASFRGGFGGSLARQFGSQSMSNFFQDQAAIERGIRGIDTSATMAAANIRAQRGARDLGAYTGFATGLLGSTNLSRAKGK